jgi:hypothetical protein
MNSNQRSQDNNQSDNGANEKAASSGRSKVTADKGNLDPSSPQSQQSGGKGGTQQQSSQQQQSGQQQQGGQQSKQQSGQQSTDRTGSQTGTTQQQGNPGQRQSNDAAGGMPRSPGGSRQAAEQDMDEETGLSNRANRQSSEIDEGSRQTRQSNVGRRDDGTPD